MFYSRKGWSINTQSHFTIKIRENTLNHYCHPCQLNRVFDCMIKMQAGFRSLRVRHETIEMVWRVHIAIWWLIHLYNSLALWSTTKSMLFYVVSRLYKKITALLGTPQSGISVYSSYICPCTNKRKVSCGNRRSNLFWSHRACMCECAFPFEDCGCRAGRSVSTNSSDLVGLDSGSAHDAVWQLEGRYHDARFPRWHRAMFDQLLNSIYVLWPY